MRGTRRVVVTGMGALSPLGVGVEDNWRRLIEKRSGIGMIRSFDTERFEVKIGGEVDIDLGEIFSTRDLKTMSRFIHFALIAAEEAIGSSGLSEVISEREKEEVGVILGTGIGGVIGTEIGAIRCHEDVDKLGGRRLSPFFLPGNLINMASGILAIKYGYKGTNQTIATACASSAHALGEAAASIAYGRNDIMIAGGTEAPISSIGVAGFTSVRAITRKYNERAEEASRPWDVDRDGFVMSEGAGVVVLEELGRALSRGAKIYAEVLGYGRTGDAYHVTAPPPDGGGGRRAMEQALADAEIRPSQIDYINAHATSTPVGDELEAKAIKSLFAGSLDDFVVTSTKSATGHMLGATGILEAIFTIKSIEEGIIPVTLNLERAAEECRGIDICTGEVRRHKVRHALSNSFGFGGTNVSLVISEYKG